MVQLRCLLALLGCKVVSYTGAQMDAEQIIAEIECLEHIFAQPDTRPLSPDDLSAVNQRTTKCTRIARGFGFGSGMAFAVAREHVWSPTA